MSEVPPTEDGRSGRGSDGANGSSGDETTDSLVLLEGPFGDPRIEERCRVLSTSPAGGLLLVAYHVSPAERLSRWRAGGGELPRALTVVTVGAAGRDDLEVDGCHVTLHDVRRPTDLSRLGLTLTKALAERAHEPTAMCFHSVTELLRLGGEEADVFRFLHLLGGQVRRTRTRAHFHVDPGAHPGDRLSRLRPLFDAVESPGRDGPPGSA